MLRHGAISRRGAFLAMSALPDAAGAESVVPGESDRRISPGVWAVGGEGAGDGRGSGAHRWLGKIDAIKYYRQATGASLADAKRVIESVGPLHVGPVRVRPGARAGPAAGRRRTKQKLAGSSNRRRRHRGAGGCDHRDRPTPAAIPQHSADCCADRDTVDPIDSHFRAPTSHWAICHDGPGVWQPGGWPGAF